MSKKPRPAKLSLAARVLVAVQLRLLLGLVAVIAALPSRWVLGLAHGLGGLLAVLDRRGRDVAFQNMDAVFGDTLSPPERKRILYASYRESVRSILLLLHLQPFTPDRFRRWAYVPEDAAVDPRTQRLEERGGVLVSGHIGNWELLLGMRILFPDVPPTIFVAEVIPHAALNRLFGRLRRHGDLIAAMRKGGARTVMKTVRDGGIAALLADRNVRGLHGGIYVPFLGLEARTTPLPAWLALRNEVPLHPVFCFPRGGGRYRIWLGPDLTQGLRETDAHRRVVELTRRINHVLEEIVRAYPELWNWTLKRFKGRPQVERGRYPAYSRYDPDSEARRQRY